MLPVSHNNVGLPREGYSNMLPSKHHYKFFGSRLTYNCNIFLFKLCACYIEIHYIYDANLLLLVSAAPFHILSLFTSFVVSFSPSIPQLVYFRLSLSSPLIPSLYFHFLFSLLHLLHIFVSVSLSLYKISPSISPTSTSYFPNVFTTFWSPIKLLRAT